MAEELASLRQKSERLSKEVVRQTSRASVLQDRDRRWRETAERSQQHIERLTQELALARADARVVDERLTEFEASVAERDAQLAATKSLEAAEAAREAQRTADLLLITAERLSSRSAELKRIYDSRGYRLVRWSWRARRRLRHPLARAAKRPHAGAVVVADDDAAQEPTPAPVRDQVAEPVVPATR